MKIIKYTFCGQVRHDVHYIAEDAICRYAADEPEKPRLKKAYSEVCELAGGIAGFPVMVKRLTFGGNYKETLITIEGDAATATGKAMTIKLPKVGYMTIRGFDQISNQLVEAAKPVDISEDEMKVIQEMEAALCDYVQNGAGQLDLFGESNIKEFKAQ